jgi:hypothetical protein
MLLDTNLVLNNFSSTIVFILCGFFLSACSTTKELAPFVPQTALSDQTTVYIYRPNEMSNAMYSPGLTIDGEFKLYVKNGVSSRLTLSPGEHLFEFQNDNNYAELTPLSLIYKAGSIYFIRVDTSLKINDSTSYQPYARNFGLVAIDEAQAVREIAVCCMDDDKRLTSEDRAATTEKNNVDGFSVDKTQNPFSH